MAIVKAYLKSTAPYSPSKKVTVEAKPKESAEDFEKRTWREKAHVNSDGFIEMPPMGFKLSIAEAARFISMGIPGKGKSTYTKHFRAGVLVDTPLVLPVKQEEVSSEWLFLPNPGSMGGTRVMKCFPIIHQWEGEVTYYILDQTITKPVFEEHLREAGKFIGLGRFRPINGGFYGRFIVEDLQWLDDPER